MVSLIQRLQFSFTCSPLDAFRPFSPEPDVSGEDETPEVTRVYMEFVKKNSCTQFQLLDIANVCRTNTLALVE